MGNANVISTGWQTIAAGEWIQAAGVGTQKWTDSTDLDTPIGVNGWYGQLQTNSDTAAVLIYLDDGHGAQQLPCRRTVSGAGKTGTLEFGYIYDTNPNFAVWLNPVVRLRDGTWDTTYIKDTYLPTLKWRVVVIPASP